MYKGLLLPRYPPTDFPQGPTTLIISAIFILVLPLLVSPYHLYLAVSCNFNTWYCFRISSSILVLSRLLRLYCLPDYFVVPFVLFVLRLCTGFYYHYYYAPFAGEISNRCGTVTFIFALDYFDHQDKEFDQDFRHFTDSSVGKEP